MLGFEAVVRGSVLVINLEAGVGKAAEQAGLFFSAVLLSVSL
jgi:hypothetical protein